MHASGAPRPSRAEIYRVPETFVVADKAAYQPRFMSLGPYHGGDFSTEEMRRNDEHKLRQLDSAVKDGGPSVLEYMKVLTSMEADARSRYDRDFTMEWDAFCRMLLLDGFQLIALLEYLSYDYEPPEAGAEQQVCRSNTAKLNSVAHDLMMLENQIPFFVVQKIYSLRYGIGGSGSGTESETVAQLAWRTMGVIMYGVPAASSHPPDECQHLVHMCHAYLKPSKLEL